MCKTGNCAGQACPASERRKPIDSASDNAGGKPRMMCHVDVCPFAMRPAFHRKQVPRQYPDTERNARPVRRPRWPTSATLIRMPGRSVVRAKLWMRGYRRMLHVRIHTGPAMQRYLEARRGI